MIYRYINKKILITVLTLVTLVIAYFIVYEFLKSSVSVSSEFNTYASVYSLPDNELVKVSKDNTSHKFRLPRGKYTIEVSSTNLETKKTISVGFRDSIDLEITPENLRNIIKTSGQKVNNLGFIDNRVVGLSDSAPILIDESGEIIYSQYEFPIAKIIYSEDDSFGEIRKNGDFSITTSYVSRVLQVANSQSEGYNPVIDADYNIETGEYCLLMDNGVVNYISKGGLKDGGVLTDKENNSIRCRGELLVVGVYARFSDGDENKGTFPGNITVYKDNEIIKTLEDVELNAIEIVDENTFIYTDRRVVSSYNILEGKISNQQTIKSLSEHSLFVSKNREIFVFDEGSVWSLVIDGSISNKITDGFNFRSVNSVSENLNGEVVFSLDSRSSDYGIYRLTDNDALAKSENYLRNYLPRKNYFYSAEYYVLGEDIVLEINLFGDIPSTSRSKEVARVKAQEFLSGLNIESSTRVIFK